MLRKCVVWCSAALVLAGVPLALIGHSRFGLGPAVPGVLLLLAILFERRGYKRIMDDVPGPDWQPTGERFLDPSSGMPVEVYFQPATGKRAYVRSA